ncbi:uncharacterized protein B4U80_11907, partial [Leptotrombidium deliense]
MLFSNYGKMNKLYAYDKSYDIDHILIPFIPDNNENFDGIPKLFILNACQDYNGIDPFMARFDETILQRICIPESDFLVAMSAVPGFKSLRNRVEGSFFIDYFLETLKLVRASKEKEDIHKSLEKSYRKLGRDQTNYEGMFIHMKNAAFKPTAMEQCPAYVSTLKQILDINKNDPARLIPDTRQLRSDRKMKLLQLQYCRLY